MFAIHDASDRLGFVTVVELEPAYQYELVAPVSEDVDWSLC